MYSMVIRVNSIVLVAKSVDIKSSHHKKNNVTEL